MTKRGHASTSSDFTFEFENELENAEAPFIRLSQYEHDFDEKTQEASNNENNEEYVDLMEVSDPQIEVPVNRKLFKSVMSCPKNFLLTKVKKLIDDKYQQSLFIEIALKPAAFVRLCTAIATQGSMRL